MTKVCCDTQDCIHCNDGVCECKIISLTGECCLEEELYFSKPEYQEAYWIAVKATENRPYPVRRRMKGKRMVIWFLGQGLLFFTSDDDRFPEECNLTEFSTGVSAGSLKRIRELLPAIVEKLQDYPPVMGLPEE